MHCAKKKGLDGGIEAFHVKSIRTELGDWEGGSYATTTQLLCVFNACGVGLFPQYPLFLSENRHIDRNGCPPSAFNFGPRRK